MGGNAFEIKTSMMNKGMVMENNSCTATMVLEWIILE